MRKALLAGVAACALMASSGAYAGIERTFHGSGKSGSLGPGAGQEPWTYGSITTILSFGGGATTDVGWGSPGVSLGVTASREAEGVSSFEITFATATIDPTLIAGAAQDCAGSEGGGTVFCSDDTQWKATLVGTHSILFTDPSGLLLPGASYFVNVMLLAGGSGSAFTGAWDVPEPASLALFGVGLAGLGLVRRRRKKAA